jgi:hypothetical protein
LVSISPALWKINNTSKRLDYHVLFKVQNPLKLDVSFNGDFAQPQIAGPPAAMTRALVAILLQGH